mgnify:CR=1
MLRVLNDYYNHQELTALAKSDNACVRKLVVQLREVARDALLIRMGVLGGTYLKDPNSPALGRALYKALQEGPKQLSEDEVGELSQLSQMAGGFWDTDPEPEFKTFEEWEAGE